MTVKAARVYRWLSRSLYVGAAVDVLFGLPLLLAPTWMVQAASLPPTYEYFYTRMNGLFLVIMAAVYFITARTPQRFMPVAGFAVLCRTVGPLFYVACVFVWGGNLRLLAFCPLNIGLAVWHATAMRKSGWREVSDWLSETILPR